MSSNLAGASPPQPFLGVRVTQHLKCRDFWKGDVSSCCILSPSKETIDFNDPATYDDADFPLVRFPSRPVSFATKENALAVSERSRMIRTVVEIWIDRVSSLEAFGEALKQVAVHRPQNVPATITGIVWSGGGEEAEKSAQRSLRHFPVQDLYTLAASCGFIRSHLARQEGGAGAAQDEENDEDDDEAEGGLRAKDEGWFVFVSPSRSAAPDAAFPYTITLGYTVGQGQREMLKRYTLKKRKFLGPTSLSSEMALLVANLSLSGKGKLVLDPYFGTGGALVVCAHYGAVTQGWEIDWRIVSGGKFHAVYDQYQLPRPDVVRGDFSLRGRAMRSTAALGWLDAIVADPPYGIRAGARKCGALNNIYTPIDLTRHQNHIPRTQPYDGDEVVRDLLQASSELLVNNGRLVYFFALESSTWKEKGRASLPYHEDFTVMYSAEQKMRSGMSRILVTMVRKPRDASLAEQAIKRTRLSDE